MKRKPALDSAVLVRIQRHLHEHPDEDLVLKVRRGKIGRIYRRTADEKTRRSSRNQRPTDALPKVKAGILMPLKRQHYYE